MVTEQMKHSKGVTEESLVVKACLSRHETEKTDRRQWQQQHQEAVTIPGLTGKGVGAVTGRGRKKHS